MLHLVKRMTFVMVAVALSGCASSARLPVSARRLLRLIDRRGALLVADDVGNVIWRVTPAGG